MMLVAPDEEHFKANEPYQTIGRNVQMPFVPFVGMIITVGSNTSDHPDEEEKLSRYLELSRKIPQVIGLLHVRQVSYNVDSREFGIELVGHTFTSLEELHMALELYKYYGFEICV